MTIRNRRIKTFTELTTKIYPDPLRDPSKCEIKQDRPIDEQVNEWAERTDVVILQVNPTWNYLEHQAPNGSLVRRSLLRYVVIYMKSADYYDMQQELHQLPARAEPVSVGGPVGVENILDAINIDTNDDLFRGANGGE